MKPLTPGQRSMLGALLAAQLGAFGAARPRQRPPNMRRLMRDPAYRKIWNLPHQGAQECARRKRQMERGTHGL